MTDEQTELLRRIDARLEELEKRISQWELLAAKFMTGPGRRLAKMAGLL